MVMLNRLYQGVEECFAWLDKYSKKSLASYCELESADDEHTLITQDGSLLSVIDFSGVNKLISDLEFKELSGHLQQALTPLLQRQGHIVKCLYRYDPSDIGEQIDRLQQSSIHTAKRLDIPLSDYFTKTKEHLSQQCNFEQVYLCIWTTSAIIDSAQKKRAFTHKAKSIKDLELKLSAKSQQFLNVLPEIRLAHQSVMSLIINALKVMQISMKLLTVDRILSIIKWQITPNHQQKTWQALLPGEAHYFDTNSDENYLLWPSFSQQLFTEDGMNMSVSEASFGEYCYAPVTIELFPKDIKPFFNLFRALVESNIPWQMSYSMSHNGINVSKTKSILAQFLKFCSHENRLICDAHRLLKVLEEKSDVPVIKLSVSLVTWAAKNDLDRLMQQKSMLIKAVQSWGGAQVCDKFGDPTKTVCSTLLALDKQHVPGVVGCPLSDAVKLMPLFRPACSWDSGSTIFRTPDGKTWPYQSGSSLQVSWVELVYARSGAGKSVLLNKLNLGVCLRAGLDELPYISILDIGESSFGLIHLLQQRSNNAQGIALAQSYRFHLSTEDAINPFDSYLGSRTPNIMHRHFLVNFISILMLENITHSLPDGMSAMITMVIDIVYRNASDEHQPKLYLDGIVTEIDEFLQLHTDHAIASNISSWWDVVDYLFIHNEISLAQLAQRYASPLLVDMVSAVHHPSIVDLYEKLTLSNGESYIEYFCRNIASCIRNYPGVNVVTKLSVTSRVTAFDLSSVVTTGSASDEKKSAIAYMLVRHATSNQFYLKLSDLNGLPDNYKHYHTQKIKSMINLPKRIVFDEFHRTSNCWPIRQQVIKDMREGRKQNVQVVLASQALADFDPVILEFATSIFILSGGNHSALNQTVKTFGLNETERYALQHYVHGPSATGMTFLSQFHTKSGINTQLLNLSLSAYELWAFTTTAEDIYLRDQLFEHLSVNEALLQLSQAFPTGTAKRYFEIQAQIYPNKSISFLSNAFIKKMLMQISGITEINLDDVEC